jgi:diacylglycerol kinase family enzyme
VATRRAVLVVNPASDGGATARRWPGIAAEAQAQGLEVAVRLTEAPGHAVELTRAAIEAGEELVVAVGGDGTVNEVVNGFARADGSVAGGVALGVLERGTGADFIRTHRIPKRPRDAVRLLVAGRTRAIDLGRVTLTGPDGERSRLYANVSSCGLTGDVARRANAGHKRIGGTPGFLLAVVAAFARWRNVEFEIEVDDQRRRLVANDVVCANGRWFGGAIKIAPQAIPPTACSTSS